MNAAGHDHSDHDTLTIGCPGCIYRVEKDQWESSWNVAPLRRCTWTFAVSDERLTFGLNVRVPSGECGEAIDHRYMDLTATPLIDAIADRFPKATADEQADMMMEACDRLVSVTVGAIIPDPTTALDAPSLFDGAA